MVGGITIYSLNLHGQNFPMPTDCPLLACANLESVDEYTLQNTVVSLWVTTRTFNYDFPWQSLMKYL